MPNLAARVVLLMLVFTGCNDAATNGGDDSDGDNDGNNNDTGGPDADPSAADARPAGDPDAGPDPGCPAAGDFGGRVFTTLDQPLRITAGGTYENLIVTSPDSDTAAIEVDTDEPVVIQYVRGSGPGNFVHAGGNSNVTILNSVYQATMQTRDGVRRGKFYAANQPRNVVIEHCELEHTSGIEVQSFAGDGSTEQTVRVRFNDAREIDGRFRNGGSEFQNFVGVQAGNRASGEIAYNRVVTTPGQGRTEDNITMYKNGGTAARPFVVYRNYVEGSYTDDYTQDATTGTAMNCDGDEFTTDADMPQYGVWEENTATGGAAINMAVGRHMRANRNTVVSVGRNRFGVRYRSGYAGMSIFNYIGTPLMIDNGGDDNRVMWLRDDGAVGDNTPYSSIRADVDQGADEFTGTVALELDPPDAEQTAYDAWAELIASAGVTIGPSWCQ